MSVLLVDAGNTRIKWRPIARTDGFDALPTVAVADLADRCAGLANLPIRTALISCVAGADVLRAIGRALVATWPAIDCVEVLAQPEACGVVNGYDDPGRLGADRWAALIGAHAGWPGSPLVVCGCGTATTLDLLVPTASGRARFTGGSILPGFDAMRRSLATTTAKLTVGEGRVVDFATRTEDAIESGILMAQTGAVRTALAAADRLSGSRSAGLRVVCLLAGGDAGRIAPHLADVANEVRVVSDLVLRGLATLALTGKPAMDRSPGLQPVTET